MTFILCGMDVPLGQSALNKLMNKNKSFCMKNTKQNTYRCVAHAAKL